ncbi:DUF262 domain-containing protein [Bacillus glycinifermentans]|uniref:DUF262 domain-containing protein n=1 Tax=Bacillus glycinifermentans TaxID=1664069 RepID=UPI001583167C|nr:DUF262 domain-containing protein [Bacillus glycinifermentans]
MKTTSPSWSIKDLLRMSESGELNFNYPIQRPSGQWDELQKSLFIHTAASGWAMPPILVFKDGKYEYVLDGKQRSSNLINFVKGVRDTKTGVYPNEAYPLHVETPSLTIQGMNGKMKTVEIAGKYFDELPQDVQSEIMTTNIPVQRIEDATDEEIEELFFRWNNGTPLTKQQKSRAKMGTKNAALIEELLKHPFMNEVAKFTPLQRRRSDDEAVILQTIMLMKDKDKIESFVADKILEFATEMRNADLTSITKEFKAILDYVESANVTSPLFKKLQLPTVFMVAKKAKDQKISPEIFGQWVEDFNYALGKRSKEKALVKVEDDYKQKYQGAGSVKRHKIIGRLNAMMSHFDEFIKLVESESKKDSKEVKKETPKKEEKASAKETDNKKSNDAKKKEDKGEPKSDKKSSNIEEIAAEPKHVATKA